MRLTRHARLLLIAFLVPLPFLFLKQLAPGNTLWLQRVWDVGHVPLFTIWMIVAVRLLPLPLDARFVLLRAFALFGAAVSIEFIQLHTGRQFSMQDMFLDACGIALGARLSVPGLRQLPLLPRSGIDLLLAVVIAFALRDPAMYFFDRVYMEVQFPQLWSASQPFASLRFANASRYVIVDDSSTDNEPLLQMNFTATEYSILELRVVKSDWRGYSALDIDVKNPDTSAFNMICRVHDEQHSINGGVYDDRFNREFALQPGWNHLSIRLADIESAPASRKMQLDRVESMSCFTKDLKQPRTAFFRDIRLAP